MDVVLHLGAHRTASTTLQAFLSRNAGPLQRRGVVSWGPARTRSGLLAGLMRHPGQANLMSERRSARSSGLVRLEMERLARAGAATLIVSEENMIGTVRGNLAEAALYPGLDVRLIRFRAGFADRCSRVALAIRSYEGYWASGLAYGVARGGRIPNRARLDRLVAQPRRWRDVIREVAQTFPAAEVVVWPFERFAGRPEAQLALMTGRPVAVEGLSGLRDWANRSPGLDRLREVAGLRLIGPAEGDLPPGPGRWMPFDTDQRARLAKAYQDDLDWLRSGADGFARFVEDLTGLGTAEKSTGRQTSATERSAGPERRGHRDEGPRHAMV